MRIKYLSIVQKNPTKNRPGEETRLFNEGMTMADITRLETKYNTGNKFPLALREFLYLCGRGSSGADDYSFIFLDEGDDPPVYFGLLKPTPDSEYASGYKKVFNSMSEWAKYYVQAYLTRNKAPINY